MGVGYIDIYGREPNEIRVYARGNVVTVIIVGQCVDVSEQRVYYDFPKTTDGRVLNV